MSTGFSDPIDRVTPTRAPLNRRPVMFQSWSHLLFLHWAVDPAALRPLIPSSLSIDCFDGRAYVGLVPFLMTDVRPRGLPAVRWLSDFQEVNVRTYVHHNGADPGVWFCSLDASNSIAVLIARMWYALAYHRAAMTVEPPQAWAASPISRIDYDSRRRWPGPRPAECSFRYEPIGSAAPAAVGTLEHFLVERYLLYCQRGRRLYQGQVHHPPYQIQPARVDHWSESMLAAAGVTRPDTPPLIHYASRVDVQIHGLRSVGP